MDNRNRIVAPRNVVNTKMLYMLYILKELSKGEVVFGNKILTDFKEMFECTSLPFPISSSTIYESLYELEEREYVVSKWAGEDFSNKRSKKIYNITDRGLSFLNSNITEYIENLDKTKATLDKLKTMLLK
ncbi:PadR family transcriptional regulator [Clostridium baratii]|uniref:PadR family transcriptional regulator n=1 Tax=Clostridium baratii TaxID=1561 RepID=UPI00097FA9FA|nr:PadR family transcriptional regulator [Clostridium baratii]AQM59494.1 PadR family transcriptional regulator [Clostridium baratii]MBS6043763.1 PadR family transcriptional regulator [Clostridium baratii]MDU1053497.1 PadR family transcriptional regulator [Clostridium baratii]